MAVVASCSRERYVPRRATTQSSCIVAILQCTPHKLTVWEDLELAATSASVWTSFFFTSDLIYAFATVVSLYVQLATGDAFALNEARAPFKSVDGRGSQCHGMLANTERWYESLTLRCAAEYLPRAPGKSTHKPDIRPQRSRNLLEKNQYQRKGAPYRPSAWQSREEHEIPSHHASIETPQTSALYLSVLRGHVV